MRTSITRVAVAAAAALSVLGTTAATAAGSASRAAARAPAMAASGAAAVPGAQLWVRRYDSWSRIPRNSTDVARSVAVSPDGATVFVTGYRHAWPGSDFATIAYNAATGARLWIQRYNGPGNGQDQAASGAASTRGGTTFVAGSSGGAGPNSDYATIAYDAVTGAQLWVQRYNGPGNFADDVGKLVVSPGGGAVFVTGFSYGGSSGYDYATIAYNAATGAQQWVQRYNGPAGNLDDLAAAAAVSPGGGTAVLTGSSAGVNSGYDYATVAYNAATGAQRWVHRYNRPANAHDLAH